MNESAPESPAKEQPAAEERIAELEKDAARYKWLAQRWSFIDFEFGAEKEDRRPVIGFDIPHDSRWTFCFDKDKLPQMLSASIDAALKESR